MPIFIPLGIPDFNGKTERDFFQFTYTIENDDPIELIVQIRNGDIVWFQDIIKEPSKLSQGEHIWKWNGFDENGIYDSAKFTQARNLNFYVVGKDRDGNIERSVTHFEANYEEVRWADVKIDKNSKKIDITLRVNFTDGGEMGTEKDCIEYQQYPNSKKELRCPWDKITTVNPSQPIIKTRGKTFGYLKKIALEGIHMYWSRHQGNIAKGVTIDNTLYEVFVNPVNETNLKISLDDVPLIFNTNNEKMRSGNPGRGYKDESLDDEAMTLVPDGIFQRIIYNVGYLNYSNGWQYFWYHQADSEFKQISAHEVGHEILQAYRGTKYSWQHKGTSYYYPQEKKPLNEESFIEEHLYIDYMEGSTGEKTPTSSKEIDLMKYYHGIDDYKRTVAVEQDVLGILWLTKLELK